MAVRILPYLPEAVPAVREFNRRMAAGGAAAEHEQFPETPDPGWMPGLELFLAVEDGAVRGGYILRRQVFSVGGAAGATETIASHYRLPLSEGLVDRAYANLALSLVRDALSREPRLYAMGMSAPDKPLPRMLTRLGWTLCAVPFHFKIVHPGRFLRHIRALRTSPLRRLAMDAAALTGAGWLGMKVLGLHRRLPPAPSRLEPSFSRWADEIWERSRPGYALLSRRDSTTLDSLYPPSDPRFLRVSAGKGWAVVLDTAMRGHKQFGDLRVGAIVDCLAPPDAAAGVIRAAAALLEQRGVDLIVSNQLHTAWSRALVDCGFRIGPSNCLLALSPALAQATGGAAPGRFHFNRGDGDGPIHL